ncbi:MAG: HAMP domain-containing histidine kinase [Chromatiaceae bacterium]|nr:HAMP domain-containing histidine kinase [Chromatiaceae bacterium]
MHLFDTLYVKLSAILLGLFLLIGAAQVTLSRHFADRYHLELTQRLNARVAAYVAGEATLIEHGRANDAALKAVAHAAMTINPSLEVYLLDRDGRILTHDLGDGALHRDRVDLGPVRNFLVGDVSLPLIGDDPRTPDGGNIFSAAAIRQNGHLEGYLYIVLSGHQYDRSAHAAEVGDTGRLAVVTLVGCLVFGLASALLIFAHLSRRLRRLTSAVNAFQDESHTEGSANGRVPGDEITQLDAAFGDMRARIGRQVAQIRRIDVQRRELLGHVSHDLRTPLTALLGHVDALLLDTTVNDTQRREHLLTARKHAIRLNGLIGELFELARLDSDAVELHTEVLPLAELASDIVQEFRLRAERARVHLMLEVGDPDSRIDADPALIARVLENLIDNAVRHTPSNGAVRVRLDTLDRAIRVSVIDNGSGIAPADLPHIFDRGYQGASNTRSATQASGLGLAIVRRILDLHQVQIEVHSQPGAGTRFVFDLARPATNSRPAIADDRPSAA